MTNEDIHKLRIESYIAGDDLQGYICDVALGIKFTPEGLERNTRLDTNEQQEVLRHTVETAQLECMRVVSQTKHA